MRGSVFETGPIVVLDADVREARLVQGWLRDAGLGMVSTARTCDEAIFLLGRVAPSLLVIADGIPETVEARLLFHVTARGTLPGPPLVRICGTGASEAACAGRAPAVSVIERPLLAQDVVVSVGCALSRPDLLSEFGRSRDGSAENLETARRMQTGLLPTTEQIAAFQASCGVGLAAFCLFGEAVGGDFWGVWPTSRRRFAVALADFAGHGLGAALNTFRLHAILGEPTLPRGSPRRIVTMLNERLHPLLPRGHYATMVYAQVDPVRGAVAWCSAGGPPPIFVTPGGALELAGRGLPLGVKTKTIYRSWRSPLPGPGILCLFSDGLFESGPGRAEVPRAKIERCLAAASRLAVAGALEDAAAEASRQLSALRATYPTGGHSDDITAVAVAIGPPRRTTRAG